jgi:Viral (Superfamily 1) RNA helicase
MYKSIHNPIGYKSRSDTIKINISINGQNYHNVTITKEEEHRVELSFIITFHKLQGKTLPKLIIQLNERPFLPPITYNGFLVALSRVKFRSDLRIMSIVPGNDILYLKKLAPDDNLQVWLGGYNSDGNWSKARCKEFYDHKKSLSSKIKQEKNKSNKK